MLDICCLYVLITYELLVSLVNGKISEGSGHSTNHFVHFHPQQFDQDGKAFLLAHRGSNIYEQTKNKRGLQ